MRDSWNTDHLSRLDRRLNVLLRDYGYTYADGRLIESASRFMPAQVLPYRFGSRFAACEWLIPIISDNDFLTRFQRITTPETAATQA